MTKLDFIYDTFDAIENKKLNNDQQLTKQLQKISHYLQAYETETLTHPEKMALKKCKIELAGYSFKQLINQCLSEIPKSQESISNFNHIHWFRFLIQNIDDFKKNQHFKILKNISQDIIDLSLQMDDEHFYLQEYSTNMRFAVRDAYIFCALASLLAENLAEAQKYTDACFQIKKGDFEYLDDAFSPYYEPRLLIYLSLFERDVDHYREIFFDTLIEFELERSKHHEPVKQVYLGSEITTNQQISTYLDSSDYQQYKSNHPIFKHFKRVTMETFEEALKRYVQVCQYLKLNLEHYFTIKNKSPADELTQIEKKQNYTIPVSLRKLLIQHGAFTLIGDCYPHSIYLYESADFKGLVDGVIHDWGAKLGFEWFEADWIEYLNSHYFLFGDTYLDDNTRVYYYFSKEGDKIGRVFFDQDDSDSYKHFVSLVFNEIDNFCTLDELLSQEIDGAIQSIRINSYDV
ncbi:MAG TPA: hypothetical protein ENJ51_00760 [Leucothrix mucor]|uniref:Knr4/Smi1-like domain-containing protein n=1 Tax=Leucothrix mucor TaxID=45248 RepID=A0A7V2SXP2_LEUMU|nr:hypothetical protein [Leucothrix mucor]